MLLFYALHQIPFILATALFVKEHRRRSILIVGAHSSSEHTCRRSNTAFSRFVFARSKSMASNELMLVDVDAEYYTDENCDSDVDYHVKVEAIMLDDDVDDPQRRSMRPYSLINEDNPFEGEDKYESEGMENLDELEEDDNHESSNKKRSSKGKRPIYPKHDPKTPFDQVMFELGMEFTNLDTFRQAIRDYAVAGSYDLKFVKNDKLRIRVKCSGKCPFLMYCARDNETNTFQVKTLVDIHKCCRSFRNKHASTKWLAKKIVEKLREQPDISGIDMYDHIKKNYQVQVGRGKVYRVIHAAREEIEGKEKDQYARIRDYCAELRRSNPGSSVYLGVNRPHLTLPPIFSRFYVCLEACKLGFQSGCRPLVGLDGTFMKGYYGGEVLTAVSQDGNDGFYVIAYAIVDVESRDTWSWFITQLLEDLGPGSESGITFVSDQQKGLVPSLMELCLRAEHRSCMRHLWVNFSKQHKGLELKKAMWDCAYATNVQQFQRCMQNVKAISESAWSWLDRLDPKVWSRHAFRTFPKNWALTSNMCEQFNSKIARYRSKPILTLAEEIRCKIMRKICKEREKMLRYHGPITPKVQDKLERDKKASRFWTPQWAGDPEGVRYEVQCSPNKYDVNLVARTCSCMEFDLTGIPCVHAIAAIGWNNLKPEDFVHPYYTKETYLRVYEPYVKPANGVAMWPQAGGDPVMPPPLKRPPGRPKKQRKKEHNETSKPNNVKRRYGENSQAGQASQSTPTTNHEDIPLPEMSQSQVKYKNTPTISRETLQAACVGSGRRIANLFNGTQESFTAP
ncbi:uncharacterized protein G2W53_021725 [Senna tora]|uniref:SWIM-type domain-containing protein n=1 Tax=Senna tora TaxID=362788 RepID=A0A834WLD7_9FABA|nr:uncharacterized protein G2W53_021725 [Senna tora]